MVATIGRSAKIVYYQRGKEMLGTTVVIGVTTSAMCILFFPPFHFESMGDGSAKLYTLPLPECLWALF